MSMETTIGREYNLLNPTPQSARQIKLQSPILLNEELDKLRQLEATTRGRFKSVTLPILFNPKEGAAGLERELSSPVPAGEHRDRHAASSTSSSPTARWISNTRRSRPCSRWRQCTIT